MAKHEFGIMPTDPKHGERYDEYEPLKYGCISVHDDYIEDILERFNDIDFYWHSLDFPGKGLAYCGITLIPPSSDKAFIDAIEDIPEISELRELLKKAAEEKKFVIHFGI